MPVLGSRSRSKLEGVNPRLVAVVERAIEITEQDFSVIEGLRSQERQLELFRKGASKVTVSRHMSGNAVDLAVWRNGTIDWEDHDHNKTGYKAIAKAMRQAAKELGVRIRWGGDWDSDGDSSDERFLDWVHFEIPKGFE